MLCSPLYFIVKRNNNDISHAILQQNTTFQGEFPVGAVHLGTGGAPGDKLMNWCAHACDPVGAEGVTQAETCTVTVATGVYLPTTEKKQ